jgi:hypothetical protein
MAFSRLIAADLSGKLKHYPDYAAAALTKFGP